MMGMQKPFRLVPILLLLAACATPNINDWPATIPPQRIFASAYDLDLDNQQLQTRAEYLGWILSFYNGSLVYPTGWTDIESMIVTSLDSPADLESLRPQLEDIGANIGIEWAKHNDVRLIDNRMLALWGSILQLSENTEQISQSIDLISEDIDAILEGELAKPDIVEARYDSAVDFGDFGDF